MPHGQPSRTTACDAYRGVTNRGLRHMSTPESYRLRHDLSAVTKPIANARCARLVVRSVGGPAVRIAHHLPIRERDCQELAAILAVTQRMYMDFNLHAGRERLWPPALPCQAGRAVHLNGPFRLIGFVFDVQNDPGMRV